MSDDDRRSLITERSALAVESLGDAIVLTIDRPATRNAIDASVAASIGDAIRSASRDPRVRGVILTGAGDRTFTSGGDLNMLAELTREGRSSDEVLALFHELSAIEQCDVPVIAAVQGDVLGGGCELVLLCDLVIAEAHATFSFRHAKMGLSPAWGGLTRLVERVGPLEASRLLFTAKRVPANEALHIGLVNEIVPKGGARARALSLVDRIADNPRATVAALKRTLHEVREARRGAAPELERRAFTAQWGGADHRAAMEAFLAKK